MGMLKYLSLFVLVLQNTTLVLVMRYSLTVEGPRYITSTAVALSEVLKLLLCTVIVFHENGSNTVAVLRKEIVSNYVATMKVSVPSILYTVQNNLLFIAVSNLDAATFQVTYQLKLFTTALFSVFMLKKELSWQQWIAVFVLMSAVILVQWPSNAVSSKESLDSASPFLGLSAVMLACITSGFSGVYFEKILKGSSISLWIRNIQLGLLATLFSILAVFIKDSDLIYKNGFFYGYNYIVLITVCLQAFGGLVVASVIKYADNILKGFATAISIVVSSLLAFFVLHDFVPNMKFLVGTFLVIMSTILYSIPSSVFFKEVPLALPTVAPNVQTKSTTASSKPS